MPFITAKVKGSGSTRARRGRSTRGDLILQVARAGRHHHAAARKNRGHEVRDGLARARAGLDQQTLVEIDGRATRAAMANCPGRGSKPGMASASAPPGRRILATASSRSKTLC
jgi:hypothetical protein